MIRLSSVAAVALCFAALPAVAQDATSPVAPPNAADTLPEPAYTPDATRLALAQQVVDKVFPAGTMQKMMGTVMNQAMKPVMDSVGALPLAEVATLSGKRPADLNKLGKASLDDIMAILDPAYRQRLEIVMKHVVPAMAQMGAAMEPEMRAAYAEAYARRFDARQLGEINAFFSTPTGGAYAASIMTIQSDPVVMQRMMATLPKAMQAMSQSMPEAIKGAEAEAQAAGLPKQRHWKDLSPAERGKLARLLGMSEAELTKNAAKHK